MRYLVLTDIHANIEALDACLADAAARHCDRTLVLGDLVGYCADPNAVVERVRALDPLAIVRGNHDKVACGLEQADGFNAVARNAASWTADALTAENRVWLSGLPRGPIDVDAVVQICHGSPHDEDAYIFDELDAAQAFKAFSLPLCLFGHTHGAVVFVLSSEGMDAARPSASGRALVELAAGSRYLINPGAVGQPRDGDPRAAYAVVDTATGIVELCRVAYDVARAQLKIARAGLPEVLAQRLGLGR
jgi:diadenosine tetraphosphatase ApaH/serine/threonine PP2A family protein phosphatase